MVSSILPKSGVMHKLPIVFVEDQSPIKYCLLYAMFNSIVFDYCVRQKLGGISLAYFILKQIAAIRYDEIASTIKNNIALCVLELSYSAYDMKPFAKSIWAEIYPDRDNRPPLPEPFPWDEDRRFLIRCELDAAFFHLYGLTRERRTISWTPSPS